MSKKTKFVVDQDETSSLRSAPKVQRHYCEVEDLMKKEKNCVTASGARKYFMTSVNLQAHYKSVHRIVVKLTKEDDDSVSSDSSMEVVDEKPKKMKPKEDSEKVTKKASKNAPKPSPRRKLPRDGDKKEPRKKLNTIFEHPKSPIDDLIGDLDQLNTDSDESSSSESVKVVPVIKKVVKKATRQVEY